MIEQALLIGLAGFRLANLVVNEDGPFDIFAQLRRLAGAERTLKLPATAILVTCLFCTSVWTTAIAAGLWQLWPPMVLFFAASTIALAANAVVNRE